MLSFLIRVTITAICATAGRDFVADIVSGKYDGIVTLMYGGK